MESQAGLSAHSDPFHLMQASDQMDAGDNEAKIRQLTARINWCPALGQSSDKEEYFKIFLLQN